MRLAHKNRYQPKHLARSAVGADIYRALAPSVLGIVLCAVCLCGTTWAWFTASTSVDVAAISTAKFLVTQKVGGSTTEGGPIDQAEWTLNAGSNVVTLTPTGTATGYCTIEFDGQTYNTGNLINTGNADDDSFTFTVNATQDQKMVIKEHWGNFSGTVNLNSGDTIGMATVAQASVDVNAEEAEVQSDSGQESVVENQDPDEDQAQPEQLD